MYSSSERLNLTWEELVAYEPRLNDLLADARAIKDEGGPYFCNDLAYTEDIGNQPSLKKRLNSLVGWDSPNKESPCATSEAWRLTIKVIQGVLPNCRKCGCMDLNGNWID